MFKFCLRSKQLLLVLNIFCQFLSKVICVSNGISKKTIERKNSFHLKWIGFDLREMNITLCGKMQVFHGVFLTGYVRHCTGNIICCHPSLVRIRLSNFETQSVPRIANHANKFATFPQLLMKDVRNGDIASASARKCRVIITVSDFFECK